MDPDIPLLSIEHHDPQPNTNKFTGFRERTQSTGASSSPSRTPFRTPRSHPHTPAGYRSSESPSLVRNARRSTPNLQQQTNRSSSSLSTSRAQTPSKTQLRRVSSNLNPDSATVKMKSPESSPPPQVTASSVAKDFFKRELQTHANRQSKTIVIVHDSCYGHRFSRPRSTKAALNTIVERPERIHATLLGASTAYVRLGQRHGEGAHSPHPERDVESLPRPPFLLKKTTRFIPLNHPAVTHVHGTKWMEELQILCDSAESKLAVNGKELQRPIGYGKDENGNNLPKLHEGDLYLCSESLNALQGCLGGVCDAVDDVFSPSDTQRAFVCVRPPGHHCSSNFPSGFCWLNNVHIGISYAAMNHGLTHAAIIDFDLHHGDGSQTITWNHNQKAQCLPKNAAQHKKTPIGYYSLHDINSYPCEWGDEDKVRNASLCIQNAHGQSIWNVHLEPWKSLEHFWQLYEIKYSVLLEKTKTFLEHQSEKLRAAGIQPKAAIFLSAGFDASQWEGQGMQRHDVNVPTDFYARLTADVVKLAAEPLLGVNGRVISVLEGGYSDRALMSGVMSHLCGLSGEIANHPATVGSAGYSPSGLGFAHLPNTFAADMSMPLFEPQWWSEGNLQALEDRVAGNIPPAPSVVNEKASGNYSSPTQASTARMTNAARERTSLAAQMEARSVICVATASPPPLVDWVVASYELSQILIPNDRQTLSCRHDELNAEATKARRERQSAIGVAVSEPRMQLRTRAKVPITEHESVPVAPKTSNRRTTIAAVSELPDPSMPAERPRRRSSAASSILSSFQDMRLEDNNGSVTNAAPKDRSVSASSKLPIEKKTRMAPPPKKAATRMSSPRKAKATPQSEGRAAATTKSKVDSVEFDGRTIEGRLNTESKASTVDIPGKTDGMDDLANGMKKFSIKLNMPTPEEHLANQKKAEDVKLKKSRMTRKPPVPKVSKQKVIVHAESMAVVNAAESPIDSHSSNTTLLETSSPIEFGSQAMPAWPAQGDVNGAGNVQIEAVSNPKWESRVPAWHNGSNTAYHGNSQSPWRTEGAEPHSVTTTEETEHNWTQKEDESIYVQKRTKADLPVFTSSSPIPFASEPTAFPSKANNDKQDVSIWDVPETPQK